MSQGIPKGYVLPTPQRAKVVGTLNIIFAMLIMLYIGGMIVTMVLSPMIMEWSQKPLREAQAKLTKQRQDQVAELKQEIAEAKTDEEKSKVNQRLDALEKTPEPKMPDLKKIQEQMMTPGFKAWTAVDLLSGLALNIAMFVSGIGLMRLKEWGRKLGLWTFGLKVVRLGVLLLVTIFFILPMSTKMSAEVMEAAAQGKGGATPFPLGDMAKFQAVIGMVTAVLSFLFASTWPIIATVLLTRPGTRAACLASAPKPAAIEPDLL